MAIFARLIFFFYYFLVLDSHFIYKHHLTFVVGPLNSRVPTHDCQKWVKIVA